MPASSTNIKSSDKENVWKKGENTFSADAVIDAYLKGIEVGRNEYTKVLMRQFSENMIEAGKATEQLLWQAEKHKVKIYSIFLKAESISSLKLLFVVDEKDFLDDNFASVLSAAREIKSAAIKDTFYLAFAFLPSTENINDSSITADGYSWNYAKN